MPPVPVSDQLLHHRLVHGVARGGAHQRLQQVPLHRGPRVGPEVNKHVANMCVDVHMSVTQTSEQVLPRTQAQVLHDAKSYLDLINLYTALLAEKREELGNAKDRLLNGLNKLAETNVIIDNLKIELGELQPVLEEKSAAGRRAHRAGQQRQGRRRGGREEGDRRGGPGAGRGRGGAEAIAASPRLTSRRPCPRWMRLSSRSMPQQERHQRDQKPAQAPAAGGRHHGGCAHPAEGKDGLGERKEGSRRHRFHEAPIRV